MKTKLPLVSVIMPVHNAGRFLVPAIESILKQTYPRIEIIIIDDGSTDGSWDTIKTYRKKYKQIKAFKTKKQLNEAGNGASNIGLLHAKGSFIARMDADDIALPQRIEKQVNYFRTNPGTIVLGSQAIVINENGKAVGIKRVPTKNGDIYRQYAIVHPIIHPSVMINRGMLPDPNTLYTLKFGTNDDYYTFFTLLSRGKFANLPETLLKYRVHEKNSSLMHLKDHFWTITKIRIEAITKLNYQAPFYVFPVMAIQAILVALLPEPWLKELFYYIRGIKKITIPKIHHLSGVKAHLIGATLKLKSSAATFLT